MEIWHRISFGKYDDVESILNNIGIKYIKSPLPGEYYIISFSISESDLNWEQVNSLISEKNAVNIYDTIFSKYEILSAEWVRLQPGFENGYPLPKEQYKTRTFENKCPKCGIGYTQKEPVHIVGEPKLKNKDFMSLYWIYVLFCTQKVLESFQANEIRSYNVLPVILHQTGAPSKILSQLLFPNIAKPALNDEDKAQPETCSECGITKYLYHKRGYMHLKRDSLIDGIDFQQTNEWFGSGTFDGFREILISNRVAKLIIENNWKGVSMKPVILV